MLIWHKKDFLLVCYFTNNGFDDESESWIARKMVIDYSRQLFEVVDCEIGEEDVIPFLGLISISNEETLSYFHSCNILLCAAKTHLTILSCIYLSPFLIIYLFF